MMVYRVKIGFYITFNKPLDTSEIMLYLQQGSMTAPFGSETMR